MNPRAWLAGRSFRLVHGHHLIYNTCWEDPRLDRAALGLGPSDTVLVITSAGCNALDYALAGPRRVHAVDVNPRQNALLELKLAGIRALDFDTFFALFGTGRIANHRAIYAIHLRRHLSPFAQSFWDRRVDYFSGRGWRPSLYFHGTAGVFARAVNWYIDRVARVRPDIDAILAAPTVVAQKAIYESRLRDAFWKRFLRWLVNRDTTLCLLGVPGPQRRQVERDYPQGVAGFVEDALEAVFSQLPLADNYFWRVYLTGAYTPQCCPEYLKRENFEVLKDGAVDKIRVHTTPISDFLEGYPGQITRYVLLDHMDWLSSAHHPELVREWQAIVDRAAPGCRLIWRSGGERVDYIDPLQVRFQGRERRVGDLLNYDRALARRLHATDRVHTYGSFHIADLLAA